MAVTHKRNTVEIQLRGITGEGPWRRGSKSSKRVVTVSLIWPRPLVASRVAVQTHTFTHQGLDLSAMDWSERILFKENVEGPYGIIVQISQSMTTQQIARVAGAIGDAVLRAAGSEAARVAVGPGMTALARFPFNYIAGEISNLGKTAQVVAAGRATLLPGAQEGMFEIPLQIPEDVVQTRRTTRGGRTQIRRQTLHKAQDPAGMAQLELIHYRG